MTSKKKTLKSKNDLNLALPAQHNSIDKLDDLDFHILWHLDYEARKPNTDIARVLGLSKQALRYRIERLKELGVIKNSLAIIDIHRLGFFTFRVYYRFTGLDRQQESQIIKLFVGCENTLWVVSTEGSWDMEVVYVARNIIHFNKIFKELHYKIGRFVRRFNISSSPVSYQLRRDYLILETRKDLNATYYGFEPSGKKYDNLDFAILTELATDAQQSNNDLANKLDISNSAIAKRIENLERDKIIRSYRQPVSLTALGRIYVKALLKLGNLDLKIEKEIFNFCARKAFVAYITEVIGEWQLEVETEIFNAKELTDFIKELSAKFPNNILDYDILHILQEHKLNYLPTGNISLHLLGTDEN